VTSSFLANLSAATRFVDAATAVCDEARRLGIHQCAVWLHGTRPVTLTVDNFPEITEDHRRYSVSQHNWDHNPIFVALRERLEPIGAETLDPRTFLPLAREPIYPFVAPVIGPDGWFATILFGDVLPFTPALERELAMAATHLSRRPTTFLKASRTVQP